MCQKVSNPIYTLINNLIPQQPDKVQPQTYTYCREETAETLAN